MTLRLLKSSLSTLRSPLQVLRHEAHDVPRMDRVRGGSLQALRRRLLARSGYHCECPDCRRGFPMPLTWDTFQVDHITRIADGGSNAMENLRAVHVDCHARITARQAAELNLYGCVLPDDAPPTATDDDMPC
jgi:5-methylcytosine-specific restriction endonuclease McrA